MKYIGSVIRGRCADCSGEHSYIRGQTTGRTLGRPTAKRFRVAQSYYYYRTRCIYNIYYIFSSSSSSCNLYVIKCKTRFFFTSKKCVHAYATVLHAARVVCDRKKKKNWAEIHIHGGHRLISTR